MLPGCCQLLLCHQLAGVLGVVLLVLLGYLLLLLCLRELLEWWVQLVPVSGLVLLVPQPLLQLGQ